MATSGFWAIHGAVVAMALLATGSLASANTMTFGTGSSVSIGSCCTPPPYAEDGIIATPTPAPGGSLPGGTHFDIVNDPLYGGASGNDVGVIHRGNGGEQIQFTFTGGNFDLVSLDITGWDTAGDPSLGGQFQSSSGATLDVSSTDVPALRTLDFSVLSGWSNISFFTFTVPVGLGDCIAGVHCSGVGFDNVVMNSPSAVPLPAALPLFASGLAGLGLLARRRRFAVGAA